MIALIKILMVYILSFQVNTIQLVLNEVYHITFYLSIIITIMFLYKKGDKLRGPKLLKILNTTLEFDWENIKHPKY